MTTPRLEKLGGLLKATMASSYYVDYEEDGHGSNHSHCNLPIDSHTKP